MCCVPGARGGCFLTTCLLGAPHSTTFALGGEMGPGRGFMKSYVTSCVWPKVAPSVPVQPSSTANRSRRRKKGPRGYDAGKNVCGRKRHIIVDTTGLLLTVVVHPANIQDRDGARLAFIRLAGRFPRLKRIWADGAYAGKLVPWVRNVCGWDLELVRRPSGQHTFEVLPRRWVVERTFAWLGRYRRLSKDYEESPQTTEAWILRRHDCPDAKAVSSLQCFLDTLLELAVDSHRHLSYRQPPSGISSHPCNPKPAPGHWIPAFAGMTASSLAE